MNTIDSRYDEPIADFGLPKLYNLVYCSRATGGVDEATVDSIIAIAQRVNPVKGITGLLVFGSGIFFQWLEGPREHVLQLMANIRNDPRHDTIIALSEVEEVGERLFPEWSMERVTTDDIREVLEDALDTTEDEKNRQALRVLLQQVDSSGIGG